MVAICETAGCSALALRGIFLIKWETMPSFLERYSGTPLGEVFRDTTPVSIFDDSLQWMDLPGKDFLQYAESVGPAPYDVPIDDPTTFRPDASFLLAQAHRISLTL